MYHLIEFTQKSCRIRELGGHSARSRDLTTLKQPPTSEGKVWWRSIHTGVLADALGLASITIHPRSLSPQLGKPPPGRVVTKIHIQEHMHPHISQRWSQLEISPFWGSRDKPCYCSLPFSPARTLRRQMAQEWHIPLKRSQWQSPGCRAEDAWRGGIPPWGGREGHEGSAPGAEGRQVKAGKRPEAVGIPRPLQALCSRQNQ